SAMGCFTAIVACTGTALLAQTGVTPWQVGDVFVGAGSFADAAGIYKTLSGTGALKLDILGVNPQAPVPDLVNGTGDWTTGCFIDPNVSDGDLWTTAWTDNTLSHFSASTHTLLEKFAFNDANGFPTG